MREVLIADYKDTLDKLDAQLSWVRDRYADRQPKEIQGHVLFFRNKKTMHFLDWRWGVLLREGVPLLGLKGVVKPLLRVDAREGPECSEVSLCSFTQEPELEDLVDVIVGILLKEITPRPRVRTGSLGLSPKEQQVLDLLLEGIDRKAIARTLAQGKEKAERTRGTVNNYISTLKRKVPWLDVILEKS